MAPKARQKPLHVIALAAPKGGVGKTTLSAALAVRAAKDGNRVALVDTDPQASLARWHELRGSPDNPRLFDIDISPEGLGLLVSEGWDWVFVDTPPALFDKIEAAIFTASFVLIPCKASGIDLEAVSDVAELCGEHGKPYGFVLNMVVQHKSWAKMTDSAEAYLKHVGPVFKERISERKPFISAMTDGKTGPEIDREGSKDEIDALWTALKRAVARAEKVR